jgi:hypothetical protein
MASFRKRGDKWEVSVCLDGVRRSASLPSKREAVDWAASQTVAIKTVKVGGIPDIPFSLLLERYLREVTPQKRGKETETKRLIRLLRDHLALVEIRFAVVTLARFLPASPCKPVLFQVFKYPNKSFTSLLLAYRSI